MTLVRTVTSLVPVFKAFCSGFTPDVDIFGITDESLLQKVIRGDNLSDIFWQISTAPTTGTHKVRFESQVRYQRRPIRNYLQLPSGSFLQPFVSNDGVD